MNILRRRAIETEVMRTEATSTKLEKYIKHIYVEFTVPNVPDRKLSGSGQVGDQVG